jgi:hypothetical protein
MVVLARMDLLTLSVVTGAYANACRVPYPTAITIAENSKDNKLDNIDSGRKRLLTGILYALEASNNKQLPRTMGRKTETVCCASIDRAGRKTRTMMALQFKLR